MTNEPRTIVLATHNVGKIEEFERLCADLDIDWIPAPTLNLPVPEETEETYLGNAEIKARAAAKATARASLADDTGLEVDAMDHGPGVRTADYAEHNGGWTATFDVLDRLLGLSEGARPAATAICALVLVDSDGTARRHQARVRGRLCWPPNPTRPGFAAIFEADGEPFCRDGVLLHRRRAFERLVCWSQCPDPGH